MVRPVKHGHFLKGLLHPDLPVVNTHPLIDERQLHILRRREGGDQVIALKDKTDLLVSHVGLLLVGKGGHISAVQVILPVGGNIQQPQHIHQCGLTGAGGADDGHKLPPVDLEVNAVQGPDLVLLALIVYLIKILYINEHGAPPINPSGYRSWSGSR